MQERISYYDNLKFILIVLVVIGHFLLNTLNYQLSQTLTLLIYSFHMPLFIFMTGFLSKKLTDKNGNFRIQRVLSFLTIYLIFKMGVYLLLKIGFHQDIPFTIISEKDTPWYLLATAIWLMLTYLLRQVKPKILFFSSIVFALIAGYDASINEILCFSRVVVFYPFFLAGYYLTKEKFEQFESKLQTPKIRMLLFSLFCMIAIICYYYSSELMVLKPIFTGQNSYYYTDFFLSIPFSDIIGRIFFYLLAILMSCIVLAFIPRKRTIFTKYGSRTLQVYVLHYFVYLIVMNTSLNAMVISYFGMMTPVIYIIVSILLTFILSNRYFEIPFSKITNYDYHAVLIANNKKI